jgi:hypothetical protein
MAETPQDAGDTAPWLGKQVPCVYCGQIIERDADRCPHCRTSFSVAVRKASREVLGPWYYLDPRNPSGRGVTLETLLKMIEKGRLKPDSIVRGPTTHQDWLFAAETPRLAKYLGLCPHCFAEAKPEDTYCTHCQLSMNVRPGEPRPGIPASLVKTPFHAAAHEIELELAGSEASPLAATLGEEALVAPVSAPAPPRPDAALAAAVRPDPALAAAAASGLAAAVSEKRTAVLPALRRRKPKVWLVLIMTWATLIPLFLLAVYTSLPLVFVPSAWEQGFRSQQDDVRKTLAGIFAGRNPDGTPSTPSGTEPAIDEAWLNQQLAEVAQAETAGNYGRAIQVLQGVINRAPESPTAQVMEGRIADLRRKIQAEAEAHLAKLGERLKLAQDMAKRQDFASALDVLKNIGEADRGALAAAGMSVEKMAADIRATQAKWVAEQEAKAKQQEDALLAQLSQATQAATNGELKEALSLYDRIAASFPPELVAKHVPDLKAVVQDLQTRLAAAATPTPVEPTPKALTPAEIAKAVADLMAQAAALEKQGKFAEALDKLAEIKKQFEKKDWPEKLDTLIEDLKAREEARKFFGVE